MSKISTDHMRSCINTVLEGATEKKREFMETIELQIGLKNYDPQKDKRFAGTIKLPHIPRPKLRICILGDAFHCEKAAGLGLDFKNADGLKAFNKNKKLIKKFGALACPASPPGSLRGTRRRRRHAAWRGARSPPRLAPSLRPRLPGRPRHQRRRRRCT